MKILNDISAEAFLMLLMEQHGCSIQEIYVKNAGVGKRVGTRDILNVDLEVKDSRLHIYELILARDGFFEKLPNKFFMPPVDNEELSGADLAKEITKRIEGWKNFFSPFEAALLYTRSRLSSIATFNGDSIRAALIGFWKLQSFQSLLGPEELGRMFLVLPLSSIAIKDFDLCGKCFSYVLGEHVKLTWGAPITTSMEKESLPKLGKAILGGNFALGRSFSDGVPTIQIHIKLDDHLKIPYFLTGGVKRKLIDEVLSTYFLPFDTQKVVILESETNNQEGFVLSQETSSNILGYSTRI